jgi:hypothetical protein
MASACNESYGIGAVMERMHSPQKRDGVLQTVECIVVKISEHDQKNEGYEIPVAMCRQMYPTLP